MDESKRHAAQFLKKEIKTYKALALSILVVGSLEPQIGNTRHIAARAETKGCGLAAHHAVDLRPRGHLVSAVGYPAPRKCALATRFRK
jgi:hypothetical protein